MALKNGPRRWVTVALPAAVIERIDQHREAAADVSSRGELVRHAVDEYLDRHARKRSWNATVV